MKPGRGRRGIRAQPKTQRFAAINWLPVTRSLNDLEANHAQSYQHYRQHDAKRFVHGHFTPALAAASGSICPDASAAAPLAYSSSSLSNSSRAGTAPLASAPKASSEQAAAPRTEASGSRSALIKTGTAKGTVGTSLPNTPRPQAARS